MYEKGCHTDLERGSFINGPIAATSLEYEKIINVYNIVQ